MVGNNCDFPVFSYRCKRRTHSYYGDNVYIAPNVRRIVENVTIGSIIAIGAGTVVVK